MPTDPSTTEPLLTLEGESLQDIIARVTATHPDADTRVIERAYEYAKMAHGQQRRKSGDLYIVHPLNAAATLAQWGLDSATVAAALLHDVPEDTEYSLVDVEKEFGKEIAFLVEGVTKLGQIKYRGVDRYIENLRRMFLAMAKDVRVILIKFADRIHNLKTLDALPDNKQYRIALESLQIYAPIANRLGMGEIKGQIEDLAFPYVFPEAYDWVMKEIGLRLKAKESFLKQFEEFLGTILTQNEIHYQSIHGRAKHMYSLFQKLEHHDHDLSQIYDLIALRIIVDSIPKCYETMGVIHEFCKPLKGRIKDYIAQPKPNGYRSLHTTVFAPPSLVDNNQPAEIIEIQIRTPQMHAEAEYGIAAHGLYKETKATQTANERRLQWVKQLADAQQYIHDGEQFLETLKIDVFANHIFVFTPHGDVIELPEGSTAVDFAYRIHTDLGDKCSGAKINEQLSGLDTKLRNGDMVEIITNPHRQGPSVDWLGFVKTGQAKHRIKNYYQNKQKKLLQKK